MHPFTYVHCYFEIAGAELHSCTREHIALRPAVVTTWPLQKQFSDLQAGKEILYLYLIHVLKSYFENHVQ